MSQIRNLNQSWQEKVDTGWWSGCNSIKTPWLLEAGEYQWGVNITNRGGIPKTRPSYRMRLTLPSGRLQGMTMFTPTKSTATVGQCLVFAVDGNVYAAPFPLQQPVSWEPYRLKNIRFGNAQPKVYWANCEKSVSTSSAGELQIVPTYSVLVMQDGASAAAYWDGELNGHLDENAPNLQTPRGTWMIWTGNRLWVARGTYIIAGDIMDPLGFRERTTGAARGDFNFSGDVTGLGITIGDKKQANLIVYTSFDSSILQSSILDRETWPDTPQFQTVLYPELGTVAGRSIVNHVGLLWWYSASGLVSSDAAAASYLSSQIKVKDMEMGRSKRGLSLDRSGICSVSFENYLLVSVPINDTYNSQTFVLDYGIANELGSEAPPAWSGVWTGIRPVEWATDNVGGVDRIFAASVDYVSLNGSQNHIWEAFMDAPDDTYDVIDSNFNIETRTQRIYASLETRSMGDGMDLKRFKYGEIDCVEIAGEVDFKVSYAGNKGGYHEICSKHIVATTDGSQATNTDVQALWNRLGYFRPQSRRIKTIDTDPGEADSVESQYTDNIDKSFCLLLQWCGKLGVEALRIFLDPFAEPSRGACEADETEYNILTEDGRSFRIEE